MSHTVRWHGWRLGLDVSEMHQKAEGVRGFSDTSWSVGQSIAYSRKNGPEFRLRIGQDDTNVTFTDGSFANRFTSRQITMSLDMTAWLRHRFERPDLFLRLDYLRRFQSNEEEYESVADLLLQFQDRNTRQGLMLSYGMKFGKVR
jgi:hypothetical protein